jgi:predicted AlkP superfamily phosphohydrolase/phosphomutase
MSSDGGGSEGDGAARTAYIGFDALDLDVAQEFIARGEMPVFARLLRDAASQETVAPFGFFVTSNWPSIYTGTTPSRHQYLCGGRVRGGTYEAEWMPPLDERNAVWDLVSDAGRRVAVFDPPHAAVRPVNGVMSVEWGCHDRRTGTAAFPASFGRELDERFGPYVMTQFRAEQPHYAPCDYAHRAGPHRTAAENKALLDDLLRAHQQKANATNALLARDDWDFFFGVFSETHCTGHQFWKLHDPTHPWHDPAMLDATGGDPLRIMYNAADATLGRLLETIGPDTALYVHLSHGMRAHYDGLWLLDPLLWKLDEYASGKPTAGRFTRGTDAIVGALPRGVRGRALTRAMDLRRRMQARTGPLANAASTPVPDWPGRRRWWAQPNDSVYASVRLNVEDREPHGRIAATHKRDALEWLAARLLEVVNVDTSEPAIANVYFTDEHYERVAGDAMGDLIIEWNRNAPVDTVWSPATGVVSAPYDLWRSGDHHERGLLLVRVAGVRPGRRPAPMSVIDVAPTLAASLGIAAPGCDGVAHVDLLPADQAAIATAPNVAPVAPTPRPARPATRRRWSADAFEVGGRDWIEDYTVGLSRALHAEHVKIDALRADVDRLDRLARIAPVSAWIRDIDVPETIQVSIVMATRNRATLIQRAIESVQQQSYTNWELLIVDDVSTDDTWVRLEKLAASDPRIRPFRMEQQGRASGARNHALDRAEGDVVVYLDDDNRFDRDWCKAVAWAFGEFADVHVAYGARVIDDEVRHEGLSGRSLPIVQFNAWDRNAMLHANLVDVNVVAHRRSDVRFDPVTNHFADWHLLLELTDDCDPLALPVVASYYTSDAPGRMTLDLRDAHFERTGMEYVRASTLERRSRS